MKPATFHILGFCCAAAMYFGTPQFCRGKAPEPETDEASGAIPRDIEATLRKNAESLNPISAGWKLTKSSRFSLPELSRKLGFTSSSSDFLTSEEVVYMFQNGMAYSRTESIKISFSQSLQPVGTSRVVDEAAYDGSLIYRGSPRVTAGSDEFGGRLALYPVKRLEEKKVVSRYFVCSFFTNAGFQFPEHLDELSQGPQSLILTDLREGAKIGSIKPILIEGANCLQIELAFRDRKELFVLDYGRGFAVRLRETRAPSGTLWTRSVLSDFEKVPQTANCWLPRNCVTDYYHWASNNLTESEPLYRFSFRLSQLSRAKIPLAQFKLVYTAPGTTIIDATVPEAANSEEGYVEYRVPASPADLDSAIETAKRKALGLPPVRHTSRTTLVIALALLLFALAAVLVYRRLRRA